jgi:hypothetical protein
VLLKLKPYTQSLVVERPYLKLTFKYFGPYSVLDRIGQVAYKLELPDHSQIHPVFHVSQLKPFTPDYQSVFSELPVVPLLDIATLEPERIIDRRLTKKGNSAATQILVKWSSLSESMMMWEDNYILKNKFPMTSAWGHARTQGGSSAMTDTSGLRDGGCGDTVQRQLLKAMTAV